MGKQVSPFALLTGAEKQIKWLEYQSVRLPYVEADTPIEKIKTEPEKPETESIEQTAPQFERPLPPPEILRAASDFQKTRHSQYDAVIARLKQAELQSRQNQILQAAQQK